MSLWIFIFLVGSADGELIIILDFDGEDLKLLGILNQDWEIWKILGRFSEIFQHYQKFNPSPPKSFPKILPSSKKNLNLENQTNFLELKQDISPLPASKIIILKVSDNYLFYSFWYFIYNSISAVNNWIRRKTKNKRKNLKKTHKKVFSSIFLK